MRQGGVLEMETPPLKYHPMSFRRPDSKERAVNEGRSHMLRFPR